MTDALSKSKEDYKVLNGSKKTKIVSYQTILFIARNISPIFFYLKLKRWIKKRKLCQW